MDISFDIPMEHFAQMRKALSRQVNLSLPQVIRGEAGAIAKTMASRTKNAKPKSIKEFCFRRAFRGNTDFSDKISISSGAKRAGARGNVWYVISGARVTRTGKRGNGIIGAKAFYFMGKVKYGGTGLPKGGNHYQKLYPIFKSKYKILNDAYGAILAVKLAKIGLTKATWIKMLFDLGFDKGAIATIAPKSATITPKVYALVNKGQRLSRASQSGTGGNYTITLRNSALGAVNRDRDLFERTVSGRRKYLLKNLKHGFADSAEDVLRAYPWVKLV